MVNFSAKILNNAVSGVNAQQAIIATAGNNIANVNTQGYSRRHVELRTRGTANVGPTDPGSGVEIESIRRINDSFLEAAMRDSNADKNSWGVQKDMLSRLQTLFSL